MFDATDTVEEVLTGIGARISAHRLSRHLTQEELAARAGVSKRSVERLERAMGNPRLTTLVAVCQVLGLAEGFDALLPAVELGPIALASGLTLPRRARPSTKPRASFWGDEP